MLHGISPATIEKQITEIIDGVYEKTQQPGRNKRGNVGKVDPNSVEGRIKSASDLGRLINGLEKQMYEHARALEFEQAAQLRDSISELKKRHFTASFMSDRPTVVS